MDGKSFISRSNYFDRLKQKSRKIDEDINNLTETWNTPHLLIGGYAERTVTTDTYLEELWESTRNTDVSITKNSVM
jgi:hypothetical protein